MEALRLQFGRRAEKQLYDILGYIALDNPQAVEKIGEQIAEVLEKVRFFPEMGKLVFNDLPHRELQAYPCRLIYRRIENRIFVVAVIRGEQLLRRSMLSN